MKLSKNSNLPVRRSIDGCYILFNSIKNHRGQVIATIKNNMILTSSDSFLRSINAKIETGNAKNRRIHLGKPKYQIKDTRTKTVVASVDNKFNIYDLDGSYLGTLKNKSHFPSIITSIIILAIIASILNLIIMKSTSSPVEPKNIIITEVNGEMVTSKWNIFSPSGKDDKIYPSKSGKYFFTITNPNPYDLVVDISFSEENKYSIDMVYKLCQSKDYPLDSEEWYPVDFLFANDIIVEGNSKVGFMLEWKWEDNDFIDTNAGFAEDASYTINVKLLVEILDEKE